MKLFPEAPLGMNPQGRDKRTQALRIQSLIWLVVYAAFCFAADVYVLVPHIFLFLMPFLCVYLSEKYGMATGVIALGLSVWSFCRALPIDSVLLFTLVIFLPVYIASILVLSKGKSFWQSILIVIATEALSLCLLLFFLRSALGGNDLIISATEAIIGYLETTPICDTYLYYFYQFGFIQLPASIPAAAVTQNMLIVLSDEAHTALINDFRSFLQIMLTSLIPSALAACSILTGTFSVTAGAKYADADKTLPYKRVAIGSWYLPKGVGGAICGLIVGYLIPYITENSAFLMVGVMMQSTFTTIIGLQGFATLEFIQSRRGKSPTGRRALAAALYGILPTLMTLLGILDQITDMRGLRRGIKLPNVNPFEQNKSDNDKEDDNK
ncbi:MAG: hypothetical protein PHI27_01500 [Eubacteriales bacterium]|nr:hypothetical protein [Eubacteriales bacterium]MDD3880910.1 hypothetical protein [Eubacteriales bacterium]MDD4511723.1 hypothetical protein [Eubacteriales bacterium]